MKVKNTCSVCTSDNIINKTYDFHLNSVKFILLKLMLYFRKQLLSFSRFLPVKVRKVIENPFYGKALVCENCGYGTMKIPPSINQLEKYYTNTYWDDRKINSENVLEEEHLSDYRAEFQLQFVLEKIKLNKSLSILEIGGGPCFFSLLLKHKIQKDINIKLNVCEPGSQWYNHYKFHGINKRADFYPFKEKDKYDYIHTSHWLEHVLDIKETITHLKKNIKKGGFLFVEVPNCNHNYWDLAVYDTPHIHFFTPHSLQLFFENNGFKLIKIETAGITINDWANKKDIKKEDYGFSHNGFWIRSIFKLT